MSQSQCYQLNSAKTETFPKCLSFLEDKSLFKYKYCHKMSNFAKLGTLNKVLQSLQQNGLGSSMSSLAMFLYKDSAHSVVQT